MGWTVASTSVWTLVGPHCSRDDPPPSENLCPAPGPTQNAGQLEKVTPGEVDGPYHPRTFEGRHWPELTLGYLGPKSYPESFCELYPDQQTFQDG